MGLNLLTKRALHPDVFKSFKDLRGIPDKLCSLSEILDLLDFGADEKPYWIEGLQDGTIYGLKERGKWFLTKESILCQRLGEFFIILANRIIFETKIRIGTDICPIYFTSQELMLEDFLTKLTENPQPLKIELEFGDIIDNIVEYGLFDDLIIELRGKDFLKWVTKNRDKTERKLLQVTKKFDLSSLLTNYDTSELELPNDFSDLDEPEEPDLKDVFNHLCLYSYPYELHGDKWRKLSKSSFYVYKNNLYSFGPSDYYETNEKHLLIKEYFFKQQKKYNKLKKEVRLFEKLESDETQKSREPIPEEVRFGVWRRDSGKCVKCGSKVKLEFDHIIPVSKGGSNTERNIQLLCEKCNREKSDKI